MVNYMGRSIDGKLVLDLKRKELSSYNFFGLLLNRPKTISFQSISNLFIKARPSFSSNYSIQNIFDPFERTHDKVLAQSREQKDIVLFLSNVQETINRVAYLLSEHIRCPVFTDNNDI